MKLAEEDRPTPSRSHLEFTIPAPSTEDLIALGKRWRNLAAKQTSRRHHPAFGTALLRFLGSATIVLIFFLS
jgi:hypothetical protein